MALLTESYITGAFKEKIIRFSAKLGMSQEQLELYPSLVFLIEEVVKSYTERY